MIEEQPRRRRLAALRAPLAVKVIGAHIAVLAGLAVFAWRAPAGGWTPAAWAAVTLVLVGAYVALVLVALRPVHELERVAVRVWSGDLGARVHSSAVAPEEVVRIGSMLNLVLDELVAERSRIRALATETVRSGDRDRASLANELHDSTAQRLAAILLQIGAIGRDEPDPALAARLASVRSATADLLEEIRVLSQTIHPRVIDDLGLPAAIRALAREVTDSAGVETIVALPSQFVPIAPDAAAALHHVARQALRNAVCHADASEIRVALNREHGEAWVEVRDNGHGFDVGAAMALPPVRGLFTMRERMALVDGRLEVESSHSGGTIVRATVPAALEAPTATDRNTQ